MRSTIQMGPLAPIFAIILALPASAWVTSRIIQSNTSPVGSAILVFGLITCCIAVTKPRWGLTLAILYALYTDYLKKIAVYYGVSSTQTIAEVMIVVFACMGCVYLGIIFGAVVGRTEVDRYDIRLFAFGALLWGAMFIAARSDGMMEGAMFATQTAFYSCLLPTLNVLMKDRDDLLKYFRFFYWMMFPWAIYGVWQYFFGFNKLEWHYAETGLSPIASAHMLMTADPRPISFGSGSMNYGAIVIPACFGIWQIINFPKHRFWFILGTIIYMWGVGVSLQRVVILFPIIVFVFYFLLTRPKGPIFAYGIPTILFILGILFSQTIIDNWQEINAAIAQDSAWGRQVFKIGTFLPRLEGWAKLARPETYTLLGELGEKLFGLRAPLVGGVGHDAFTRLVIRFGAIGVGFILMIGIYILRTLHSLVNRIPAGTEKSLALFLISIFVCYVAISLATGGNFNSNPYNFLMWFFLGGAYMLSRRYGVKRTTMRLQGAQGKPSGL